MILILLFFLPSPCAGSGLHGYFPKLLGGWDFAAQTDRSPHPIVPKPVPHGLWEQEEGLSSKQTQKSRWRMLGAGNIWDDIWDWQGESSWRKHREDPWRCNSPSLSVSKKKQRQWIGPTGLNQTGEEQLPGELGMGFGVPKDGIWGIPPGS